MVRTHSLRLLAAALLFAAGTVQADSLAQLKQFMDGTRSARGSFTQQVFSKSGRKPQQASGTFAFSRPGKFRWTYEKPYAQLLVGDGSKLWAWDQELNQVTTKKLGQALGSTPAAILAGDNALEKNFTEATNLLLQHLKSKQECRDLLNDLFQSLGMVTPSNPNQPGAKSLEPK